MWQQHVAEKTIHDNGQNDDLDVGEHHEQDRSFDVVRVEYINLDSIKSTTFTKLESGTGQRQRHLVYKADTGADGNFIPFKIFKIYFLNQQ